MARISHDVAEAAALLRAGKIVAFPTETVYGLGGLAADGQAVARIYEAKERPRFNPLIVHLNSAEDAFEYGQANQAAKALAHAFWPGPMTLILPLSGTRNVSGLALAGLKTVALRVPAHPIARALIAQVGAALVAPSANKSGRVSPTQSCHVARQFGDEIDLILEGGICDHGLESIIIDLTTHTPVIRRPGPIARAQIEAVIGPLGDAAPNSPAPNSPGQLAAHYAPLGRVHLDRTQRRDGAYYIGFGPQADLRGKPDFNLSSKGNLVEAAANLFAALHAADAIGAKLIDIAPIPSEGLGDAICDRLGRAAATKQAGTEQTKQEMRQI